MIRAVTKDQIAEALEILGLTGETGCRAKYEPYHGPHIMLTAEVMPFVVRIDDYGYYCSEVSKISTFHDRRHIKWKGKWEPCSPYLTRVPCRFLPRKGGEEYGYQRRKFVIDDGLFVITERYDAIDRVFLCNDNPGFDWQFVVKGLIEYHEQNFTYAPSPNNKRIQLG